MGLEKGIIKASVASQKTFDFKPREIEITPSGSAVDFANDNMEKSSSFAISDLIAQQTGISKLQSEAQQDSVNARVLEKLKEVEEKAYREGYDLGQIEGTEKAFKESQGDLNDRLKVIEEIIKSIEKQKRQILIDNEATVINLVFQVAKKLALRDLSEHREAAVEILREVLGQMTNDEKIVVHLANEDLLFIETFQEKSNQRIEGLERTKLIASDKIQVGGALIETDFGTVDASVEERVERVWQTLQSKIPKNIKGSSEG